MFAIAVVLLNTLSFASLAYIANRKGQTNIWHVVSGGWLIGLGGDHLWRDFVAPFLGFEEG